MSLMKLGATDTIEELLTAEQDESDPDVQAVISVAIKILKNQT